MDRDKKRGLELLNDEIRKITKSFHITGVEVDGMTFACYGYPSADTLIWPYNKEHYKNEIGSSFSFTNPNIPTTLKKKIYLNVEKILEAFEKAVKVKKEEKELFVKQRKKHDEADLRIEKDGLRKVQKILSERGKND